MKCSARRPWLLAAVLACVPLASVGAALDLPVDLTQGQLVMGHAEPGCRVRYADRDLRIGANGLFVLGLGRDAAATVKLTVHCAEQSTSVVRTVKQRDYDIERINGLPQKTVTPNPKLVARIHREQAGVVAARKIDSAQAGFDEGFLRPVQGGRISGVFGSQRIDNGVPKSPHYGLDMAVPAGTPVHAPADGTVSFAATGMFLTGGTVLIDHGFGLNSSFLHMQRVDVEVGDKVSQGDVIGAVGMTGRATGPHLHWGFNWFDVRLDPALLPKAE